MPGNPHAPFDGGALVRPVPHPTLLRNLFHFLSFRLDAHAQKEIRLYAQAMAEIVRKVTPVA